MDHCAQEETVADILDPHFLRFRSEVAANEENLFCFMCDPMETAQFAWDDTHAVEILQIDITARTQWSMVFRVDRWIARPMSRKQGHGLK